MQILLFATLGAMILIYILLCKLTPEKLRVKLRKNWWLLPALLFTAYIAITSVAQNSATLSKEEILGRLEDKLAQQLQGFDESYGCEGSTVAFYSTDKLSITHPHLALGNSNLMSSGHVEGDVTIVVDTPAAYPYWEKAADSYTLNDMNELYRIKSDILRFLDLEETSSNRRTIVSDCYYTDVTLSHKVIFLDPAGNEYFTESGYGDEKVFKNGEKISELERPKVVVVGGGGGSGSGSGGSCSACGGTGVIRYNYGSSDLEAILSGHDPYTYQKCYKCGGSGK